MPQQQQQQQQPHRLQPQQQQQRQQGGVEAAEQLVQGLGEEALCIHCMERPRSVGVLHGSSVHKVLCCECATQYEAQPLTSCPLCRKPVERFVDLFD